MIKLADMTNLNVPLLLTVQQWILDNGGKNYTHFRIDEYCSVPAQFIRDKTITLNLSPGAVENLVIDEKGVSFHARFNGLEHHNYFPFENIIGVSGGPNFEFGIGFPFIDLKFKQNDDQVQIPKATDNQLKPTKVPHLRIVK